MRYSHCLFNTIGKFSMTPFRVMAATLTALGILLLVPLSRSLSSSQHLTFYDKYKYIIRSWFNALANGKPLPSYFKGIIGFSILSYYFYITRNIIDMYYDYYIDLKNSSWHCIIQFLGKHDFITYMIKLFITYIQVSTCLFTFTSEFMVES